jgi:hypothetical protein
MNKKSFLLVTKIENAPSLASAVLPSASLLLIEEELTEARAKVHQLQDRMMQALQKIAEIQFTCFPYASPFGQKREQSSNFPVEFDAFCSLRDMMQKQQFLEMCIAEELCGVHPDPLVSPLSSPAEGQRDRSETRSQSIVSLDSEEKQIDQDKLTTMLACLSYPPYLRESEIEAVLALTG